MDPDKKATVTDTGEQKPEQTADRHIEDVNGEAGEKDSDVVAGQHSSSDDEPLTYVVDGEVRTYVPNSPEEKKMVLKIDLHMFSCTCVMYLLNCTPLVLLAGL